MAEKRKNLHAGHRQRMKDEFLARGLEGIPDHKVLEMMLFYAIPQGDVNPLAHTLIERFGSLSGVFNATYEQLLAVRGVGKNTATLLRFLPALFKRYGQACADPGEICQTSWDFRTLLEPEFFGARNELVYMVCLDGKMKLISCRKLAEGIPNAVSITIRKVMETALACNSTVVALAHNHVSGLAVPSAEDVSTTIQLARSLSQVGILLYDHFILADGDMVSMRESGYLKD